MARVHLSHKPRIPRSGMGQAGKVRLVQQPNHTVLPENKSTGRLEEGVWLRAGDLKPGMVLVLATGLLRHHYLIEGVARQGARVEAIGQAPRPNPVLNLSPGEYQLPAGRPPHWVFSCTDRVQVMPKGHTTDCL